MQQVIITDIAGRIMIKKQFEGGNSLQLSVSKLGKGAYLVKVTTVNGNIQTAKLVLQ